MPRATATTFGLTRCTRNSGRSPIQEECRQIHVTDTQSRSIGSGSVSSSLPARARSFLATCGQYDIRANLWVQLSGNSSGPSPRYGHSATYDSERDRIVISHGFTSEEGRFDDTWAFDLANNSWRDISPASTRQLRRCLHHAVYVPLSDEMLLDGSCSGGFGPCAEGDLWSFELANNRWAEITSNPRPARRQR